MADKPIKNEKEVDLYRDTPVRLLGYANEVGESFRALVHVNWVRLSYVVASGYVCADTVDKCIKQSKIQFIDEKVRRREIIKTAVDTLIWQTLASVMIPGFTINRICKLSLFLLARYTRLRQQQAKWSTVFVGLGSIPFIVKPIDNFVDLFMDSSVRKIMEP